MELYIPKYEEQVQIGQFFKILDDTIALHQRKLDCLKANKKVMLSKMFPKNGASTPEIRIGNFVDKWEQRKLGDVLNWSKGDKLPKALLNKNQNGRPVLHYADLYKFGAVQKHVIHWSTSDQGRLIPENSILFPMSDVTPFGLARTTNLLVQGVMAGGDVLIGTTSKNISAQFLSYQINARPEKILPLVTGTTVKHINSSSLSTIVLLYPSSDEQLKISEFFMSMDDTINLHQKLLDEILNLKLSLLSKMYI